MPCGGEGHGPRLIRAAMRDDVIRLQLLPVAAKYQEELGFDLGDKGHLLRCEFQQLKLAHALHKPRRSHGCRRRHGLFDGPDHFLARHKAKTAFGSHGLVET